MPLSAKAASTSYFTTGLVALCIVVLCTLFSLAIGAGALYFLPFLFAAILIVLGMLVRSSRPSLGATLSGAGALVGAPPLLAVLLQYVRFAVAQPQFAPAIAITVVLLLLLLVHPCILFANYKVRHIAR